MGQSGRQAHTTWCHPAPRQQQCPSSDGGARLSSTGSSDAPTANASPERRRLTHALLLSLLIHTLLLSLTFGGQGLASGFRLPLAGSTDRGTRSARRSRSGAGHSRGAGGHAGRGAVAAGIGRAACCQWAGADAIRVPCADPAADCTSERRRRPIRGQRSIQGQTPRPVRPLRKRLCAPIGPVTRRPRRSPRRP